MEYSHTQTHQHPQTDHHQTISIDDIQSSLNNLIQSWTRRQRWQHFLNYCSCCHNDQLQEHNIANKRSPWRNHLANLLQSTPLHTLSLSLLLVDLVFTVLDLSSSLISCNSKHKTDNDQNHQLVYHYGGIVILALLSAKALGLIVALGGSFFRRPGHVVDAIVVFGALAMELLLKKEEAGLLVVVSLWRVVRVVESAFEISDEAIAAKIEEIVSQFEVLRGENQRLQEAIDEKDKLILELEEALDKAECTG